MNAAWGKEYLIMDQDLLFIFIITARWLVGGCGALALNTTWATSSEGRCESEVNVL
jgi:hypothetical protein